MAKYLVTAGADVNAAHQDGSTPRKFAAANGYLDMEKYLVTAGADVNAAAQNNLTPLYVAAGSAILRW